MSATFKNAKKKLSQAELRKFMNEHKVKAKDVKKIESPLAKYPFTIINICLKILRGQLCEIKHVTTY